MKYQASFNGYKMYQNSNGEYVARKGNYWTIAYEKLGDLKQWIVATERNKHILDGSVKS